MNILAEAAGYIAGLCIATCFLPQTLRTIRSKNVQELSLTSYLHSVQMILFNLISLYFAGTILFMIVKYKKKD